jgi:hypothetical protein
MFRANASCLAFNGVGSKTVRWCYLTCTFPAAIGLQAMPKSARDYGRLKLSLSRVEPGSGEGQPHHIAGLAIGPAGDRSSGQARPSRTRNREAARKIRAMKGTYVMARCRALSVACPRRDAGV